MHPLTSENAELRRALDLEVDPISHRWEVARLVERFRHTITFEGWNHEETCVPWALQLTGDAAYEGIRRRHTSIYAGPDFADWLITNHHLVELSAPKRDCLVFYYAGKTFKHAGVMIGESRVRSKWGTMPRYDHHLTEVPSDYGSQVRFFERPNAEIAKKLFRSFAEHRGLTRRQIILASRPP